MTLVVNGVPSSHLDLDDPGFLAFEYMQQMAAAIDLVDGPLHAVHLGAAGCTLARWIDHERPGSRQLAVDIDGRLLTLVREWFALPRAPRLRLREADARAAVTTLRPGSTDVVVRDVFAGDVTPEHVTTVEFVQEVARTLRPGGLYLANCADRPPLTGLRTEIASLLAAQDDAGAPVFRPQDVGVVAEPALFKSRRYGNFVLVARARAAGDDGTAESGEAGGLADTGLARALRSLPVPARLVSGTEAVALCAGARPRVDPAPPA
ncbi:methyltransferase family protein [Sediminihabitans luteus]|uniref:Methyltransferase family protein n=1 Tax=Sediminihabitans luteus TaxID=1138585 RepID=A0A2M9CCJ2_9CELL|nr:methyltransferase family protein [Sediminihabitans luteus]GII99454.1 hypothetical protein Slu03_18320 [Sediminihabitans luteus]